MLDDEMSIFNSPVLPVACLFRRVSQPKGACPAMEQRLVSLVISPMVNIAPLV